MQYKQRVKNTFPPREAMTKVGEGQHEAPSACLGSETSLEDEKTHRTNTTRKTLHFERWMPLFGGGMFKPSSEKREKRKEKRVATKKKAAPRVHTWRTQRLATGAFLAIEPAPPSKRK